MPSASDLFWLRVQRRASRLTPDISAAALQGFAKLRAGMSESQMAALLQGGSVERLLDEVFGANQIDPAFVEVRERLRQGVVDAIGYFTRELPPRARPTGNVSFAFDTLNPEIVTATRGLQTKVMTTLTEATRETVRAYVENGLRDGTAPRTIARGLRSVVGLAPNQELAVRNFRTMLESGDREALTRALRDRRFDATLTRALGQGGAGLTPDQVDRMTTAYGKRMLSFHAETVARTAVLDAQKMGQKLTWDAAVARGDVDGDRLMKRWSGVMDDREREEHVAMQGETVSYNQPYSNGNMVPGDDTYNCRCLSIFFQAARVPLAAAGAA